MSESFIEKEKVEEQLPLPCDEKKSFFDQFNSYIFKCIKHAFGETSKKVLVYVFGDPDIICEVVPKDYIIGKVKLDFVERVCEHPFNNSCTYKFIGTAKMRGEKTFYLVFNPPNKNSIGSCTEYDLPHSVLSCEHDERPLSLYDEDGFSAMEHFEAKWFGDVSDIKTVKFVMFDQVPKTASGLCSLDDNSVYGATSNVSMYRTKNTLYIATQSYMIYLPANCNRMFAGLENCERIEKYSKINFNCKNLETCEDVFRECAKLKPINNCLNFLK